MHRAPARRGRVRNLGLIAGGGELPRAVAESVKESGGNIFIVGLRGLCGGWAEDFPHEWVSLGEPGRALKALKTADADRVLLAGRVERPKFSELRLDAKGVMVMPKVLAAARQGDDVLLRLLVDLFEAEGFRALGVAEAAPGLVAQEGPLGRFEPNDEQRADIARAFGIVRALGALDVGQAAVVCEGLALAVEAAEGTDQMIARIGQLRESLRGTPERKRGVLVKALKPTQDAKTDMPVIGRETVRRAAEVGLAGIALEAGKSLIVGKRAVRDEADRLGLFVTGVTP
ncbi:MAG TPA: UDP-2,3-diacylglucosamine diphosphatase LpxI [Rhizomicrobium sp.]|nr:UDP-2,3-diacylglucosamine diphosphatase LpxI [Rhizomicrobium sp.]